MAARRPASRGAYGARGQIAVRRQPGVDARVPCTIQRRLLFGGFVMRQAIAGSQPRFPAWEAVCARNPPLAGNPARGADELRTLIYTSGTTGKPKGVMHSFGNFSWALDSALERVRRLCAAQGAEGAGAGPVPLRGRRCGADAGGPAGLVPQARPADQRRLRHDRKPGRLALDAAGSEPGRHGGPHFYPML